MIKITIALLFALINCTSNAQTIYLPIVPTPKIVQPLEGNFQLKNKIDISVRDSVDKNLYTIEQIQKTLSDFNKIKSQISSKGEIEISFMRNGEKDTLIRNMTDEGYVLRVLKNKIELKAKTAKGIYYAAMSLIQMLEKAEGSLPCAEIIDWPDMKIRGVSDDISRGQVSNLDNFKKIISHMARYKMNTYMPYIEDMLEFEKYPTIGKNRGALTKHEAKEIVEFAKKNFVEVIPIFQTLGHYENILSQDEFLKYAEFPGAASLNVSSDSTYYFLEDLLKEVFELFPSEYFHMGADESWDVGLGASKKLVEETNIAVVHANHYKKVYDICKKYSKKVMMYGDILLDYSEILSLIPKDIIIVDWHYGAEDTYPSTKILKNAGFNYIVSPSAWNFTSTFPVNVNSLPNIKNIVKSGLENESLGMINSNWGDYGAETFKEFVLYNYAWSAQCAWNLQQSDLSKFNHDYFYDFFGIDDDKAANIYTTLSNPLNQISWNEVWRHPMLNFKDPPWWEPKVSKSVRISWNEMTLPELKMDAATLKLNVKKNNYHFELIEFLLALNDWYKFKLETQFQLQQLIKGNQVDDLNNLRNGIHQNIESLQSLKQIFRKLWLQHYKQDNLSMIEDKFDRLTAYFKEINENLLSGNIKNFNPLLDSKWLYVRNDDNSFSRKAEFKTSFALNSPPIEAYLQMLGNTYAELYINEKFAGRVYARRSLSLLVDYRRIMFVDIKPFLNEGENTIRIVAENFSSKNGAGFNLISSIKTSKDTLILRSDDLENNGIKWMGHAQGSNSWTEAVSVTSSSEIIAPNFKTKRTSWFER